MNPVARMVPPAAASWGPGCAKSAEAAVFGRKAGGESSAKSVGAVAFAHTAEKGADAKSALQ